MTTESATPTAKLWSAEGTKQGTMLAALAGILFAVLSLARIPLTREDRLPTWDASSTEIVDFYQSLTFEPTFIIGIGMGTTGWLLYLVFITKFASIVGRTDRGSPWVGRLIISLAITSVGLALFYLVAISIGAKLADAGVGQDSFLMVHSLANSVIWFAMLADALLSTAIGLSILISGAFPKWLGVGLIGTAALEVFAFFGPADMWIVVGGLVYLWSALLAVTMLIRADRYSNFQPETRATGPALAEGQS